MPSNAFLRYVGRQPARTERRHLDAPTFGPAAARPSPAPAVGLGLIVVLAVLLAAAVFLVGATHPVTEAAVCSTPTHSVGAVPAAMPVSCLP